MKKKEKVLAILKTIEQQKGVITPQDVVEVARPVSSPLHSMFEWQDTKAAEQWRLYQARHLLTTIKVELLGKQMDGFWNVKTKVNDVKMRGYYSSEKVIKNDDMYLAVLKEAVREINYWVKKYHSLKELKGLINDDKLEEINLSL